MDSEGNKKGVRPKVVYFVLFVSSMCALRMSMIAHQFPLSYIKYISVARWRGYFSTWSPRCMITWWHCFMQTNLSRCHCQEEEEGGRLRRREKECVCPKVLYFVLLVSSMCALRKYVIAHRWFFSLSYIRCASVVTRWRRFSPLKLLNAYLLDDIVLLRTCASRASESKSVTLPGRRGRRKGRQEEEQRRRKRRIYLVSLLTSSPHTTATAISNLQLLPLHQQPLLLLVTIPTSTCPPPSPCPSPPPSPSPCIHIAPPAPRSSSPAPPPHSPLFPHSSTSFPALSNLQTLSPLPATLLAHKLPSLTTTPTRFDAFSSPPSTTHTPTRVLDTSRLSAQRGSAVSASLLFRARDIVVEGKEKKKKKKQTNKQTRNASPLRYLLAPDLITNVFNSLTHLTCVGWIAAPLKGGGSGGGGFVVASTTMASRRGGLAALLCFAYLLTDWLTYTESVRCDCWSATYVRGFHWPLFLPNVLPFPFFPAFFYPLSLPFFTPLSE